VDDIIDSGGTMLTALKTLKAKYATSVSIACIHPVLTGNIITRLYAAGAKVVAATDTIPSQISRISVAPIIAAALK
jgi:ribose-phosphate pyrophosphokinase